MSPSRKPGGTGELFTEVGLQPAAEALPPNIELTPEQREQQTAAHLSAVLGYYDTLLLDEGFLRMAGNPQWFKALKARYGKNTERLIQGRADRHKENLDNAKREFFAAYRVSHPAESEEDAKLGVEEAYRLYEGEFRGESPARKEKRRVQQQAYEATLSGEAAADAFTPSQLSPERMMPTIDPKARNSLARAIRPEYFGYTQDSFEDVSWGDMVRTHPASLLKSLVNVGGRSKNSLGYIPDGQRHSIRVTFTPAEWKMVLRSGADQYAVAGENTAETKRRTQQETVPNLEDDEDAPRRAGIHTIKTKRDMMQLFTDNVLERQLDLVHRFQEASDHPGLARFGNEANMRQQLEFLLTFVVGDMLWAVGKVQKWSREEEERAQKAVRKAVFMTGEPAIGRKNFRLLIDTAETWIKSRLDYCNSKDAEIDKYLRDHQTSEEYEADERERLQQSA